MHYVYVLENQRQRGWQVGVTDDLDRELQRRNTAQRERGRYILIYLEGYVHRSDAQKRASFLKTNAGEKALYQQNATYLKETFKKMDYMN